MKKSRDVLQVSPIFKKKLSELQIRIMKSVGKKVSINDLTEYMTKSINMERVFEDIEVRVLNIGELNNDMFVRFDRRKVQ